MLQSNKDPNQDANEQKGEYVLYAITIGDADVRDFIGRPIVRSLPIDRLIFTKRGSICWVLLSKGDMTLLLLQWCILLLMANSIHELSMFVLLACLVHMWGYLKINDETIDWWSD